MNKKLGKYSSLLVFFSVLAFALCMLFDLLSSNATIWKYGSYLSCIFIALGFIPMVCSYISFAEVKNKATVMTALAFSIMYGIIIVIVYFTQLTTVRLTNLSEETIKLLDYSKFDLFFNYDLLGYGFMALSTFFIGIQLETKNMTDKILKKLLVIHGVFFISCFILPMIGTFSSDMEGGDIIGTIVLEFWCIYFMPISILSYKHFNEKELT